ncbi:probable cysteine protease RDL5 [Carya illinoinensis]|uniref:probable cysteine protease RDL5 n=1 Tax=Carya illinoinensis TaxID=32201 RepID=UPI001C7199C9|nr:probable cysteine protease RDL5 [Carya illinoinensis]
MCWAIVAAEAVAAGLKATNYTDDLLELSSQELLDCCEKERTKCYTYSYTKAFNYIKNEGIRKEEDYQFKAVKQPCQPKTEEQKSLAVRINGVIKINHKSEEELLMRVKEQPVAGCVMMTTEFKLLKGDIYEGTDELDKLNQDDHSNSRHAILVIGFGYDEKEEKNYWIVKNSYGKEWGIHGYGRIARNSSLPHNRQNLIFRTAPMLAGIIITDPIPLLNT